MPVRFKYTRVEPVSYGLNAVDILLADDRELNRYVPLKKLAPYVLTAVHPALLTCP